MWDIIPLIFVLRVFVLCFFFCYFDLMRKWERERERIFEENILIKIQVKKRKRSDQIKRRSSFRIFFLLHINFMINSHNLNPLFNSLSLVHDYGTWTWSWVYKTFWTGFRCMCAWFKPWNWDIFLLLSKFSQYTYCVTSESKQKQKIKIINGKERQSKPKRWAPMGALHI